MKQRLIGARDHLLRHTGLLDRRGLFLLDAAREISDAQMMQLDVARAAETRLMCALQSCSVREKHAAHFKKCSARKAVVYCCKEHQVENWPAHKAACKAARAAAAAAPTAALS